MHSPIELNKISLNINSKSPERQVTTYQKDDPDIALENIIPENAPQLEHKLMSLPELTPDKVTLQDTFCNNILTNMHCNSHDKYFTDPMGILHKTLVDLNSTFSSIVVPKMLIKYLLHAFHNSLGHIGAMKLYHFIKRLYYFPNRRKTIHKYVRTCQQCQIMNLQKPNYIHLHQESAQTPQDHLSIDFIGPYITTTKSNTYAPTAIFNLIGYLMTTHIPNKKITTLAVQLFSEIFPKFGFPSILHSDNIAKFISKFIKNLTQQIGVKKTFISPSPHHPQPNGKLESSHQFIKDCIRKFSIDGILEWNQLLPYAMATLNWFLNELSQEYPHFLYFGCNPYLPHLTTFQQPKLRYLGTDKGMT